MNLRLLAYLSLLATIGGSWSGDNLNNADSADIISWTPGYLAAGHGRQDDPAGRGRRYYQYYCDYYNY